MKNQKIFLLAKKVLAKKQMGCNWIEKSTTDSTNSLKECDEIVITFAQWFVYLIRTMSDVFYWFIFLSIWKYFN